MSSPELKAVVARMGVSARVASAEASAAGLNWTYAPMVDIGRDPADGLKPLEWTVVQLARRDGIGSLIEVRAVGKTQSKDVTVGGGHAGGQLEFVHFGLGDAAEAEVRVRWPDGTQGAWQTLTANTFYALSPADPPAAVMVPPAALP